MIGSRRLMKYGLATLLLLLAPILVYGSQCGKTYTERISEGYRDGKAQAVNDWENDQRKGWSCPKTFGEYIAYCTGYTLGYGFYSRLWILF